MLLSKFDSISYQAFKQIEQTNIINRTIESLKSRHRDYLKYIDSPDLNRIIEFIKLNGMNGFLVFEDNPRRGHKKLKEITLEDPKKLHFKQQVT